MKEIPLGQYKVAIVDDEDYEKLLSLKWHLYTDLHKFYAIRHIKRFGKDTTCQMHQEILGFPNGMIDHINGNGLDNRKENLRICNCMQNQCNRGKQINNTSGYKGVSYHKRIKKWQGYITVSKKRIHLGFYKEINCAAIAYNNAALKYHGDYAFQNSINNPNGYGEIPGRR